MILSAINVKNVIKFEVLNTFCPENLFIASKEIDGRQESFKVEFYETGLIEMENQNG